jgi:pyruvate/2-oxoglutarate dehydrogenase complex dihydrolipoamide acyltransferase (E2) component
VFITVGGINQKIEHTGDNSIEKEYLCLTASFDHNIVDGAPAARFMKQFTETIKNGKLIITGS